MGRYLLRRLLLILPTLFGIMVINFVIVQFAPGGPVEQVLAEVSGFGGIFDGGGLIGRADGSERSVELYGWSRSRSGTGCPTRSAVRIRQAGPRALFSDDVELHPA